MKLLHFLICYKIETIRRVMLKTLLKKASYSVPNAIPAVIMEKQFVKTRTSTCHHNTAGPKNNINSCKTDASLQMLSRTTQAMLSYQKSHTFHSAVSECWRVAQQAPAVSQWKMFQISYSSSLLWQAGISQVYSDFSSLTVE